MISSNDSGGKATDARAHDHQVNVMLRRVISLFNHGIYLLSTTWFCAGGEQFAAVNRDGDTCDVAGFF